MDWRAAWLYRIEQAEGAATRARCATYLDDALRAGDFEKLKFLLLRNKGKGEAMNLGKLLRGGKGEQVCAACAATSSVSFESPVEVHPEQAKWIAVTHLNPAKCIYDARTTRVPLEAFAHEKASAALCWAAEGVGDDPNDVQEASIAYGVPNFPNSVVFTAATAPISGDLEVKLRTPRLYRDADGQVYPRHVHYAQQRRDGSWKILALNICGCISLDVAKHWKETSALFVNVLPENTSTPYSEIFPNAEKMPDVPGTVEEAAKLVGIRGSEQYLRAIVLFCKPKCDKSKNAAKALIRLGLLNVFVLEEEQIDDNFFLDEASSHGWR